MSAPAQRFLKTRVARRLFVLFVVCAFLPLAVVAVLSLSEVRSILLQQGDQRLAATAKSYGMTLFERLLLTSEVAVSAAAHPEGIAAGDSLPTRIFQWLAFVDRDGKAVSIIGRPSMPSLSSAVHARLNTGKPAVMLAGEGGRPRVVLAAPIPAPATGIVVGELKPEFLWGPADELPAATEFCVVEERTRRLMHCSSPSGLGALRVLGNPGAGIGIGTGAGTWQRGDEKLRARVWGQFMRVGFGTEDWLVVASQPESYLLARLLEFRGLYIPVVGLALVLVLWLTIRQARHIVEPVSLLAERARGVARNDFRSRVGLERDDEFGELAGAFDNMSERLGRQFATLTALSEIDRLILSTQDTAEIVRTVLQRLAEMVAADMLTVTLFDNHNPGNARTFFYVPGGGGDSMVRHAVSAADLQKLRQEQGALTELDPAAGAPAYLAHAAAQGMASAFVQPIVWRGDTCGAIVLAYRAQGAPGEDEIRRTRELADRVAVAVSSAWRDEQLYAQAHFDALTGAPNRLLFTDRLTIEIARSKREKLIFALLFVDLDHFKNVNDSFGHTAGDQVLRETVSRIGRCIRGSDTVSRLGGDEFTVLLTNLHHPEEAWLIAETMLESLSREFVVGSQQCFLSASIGIAAYPGDGETADDLLKSADTAMYRAKATGRAQVVFFEERMNAEAVTRVTLDHDLRLAIDNGELVLHFQPILDLRTGRVRAAEALVRWQHPTRGLIPPSRFIPLAEETGYIEHIGHWTLQQACMQASRWRAEGIVLDHVSVNVSPRQFRRRALVNFIGQCVADAGLPASALQIEITEGLLVDRGEAIEGMLRALADSGHEIALDDFGTGFSSMAYLKRFPVHAIKIDRVFVDGLERSPDSEAIVSAIIAMSHALGKRVIAEGVETDEQLAILRRVHCDEIQGFVLSTALPADEFAVLVRARASSLAVA